MDFLKKIRVNELVMNISLVHGLYKNIFAHIIM